MKKILLISIFGILLAGCAELKTKSQAVPESSDCKSNLAKWLSKCTIELVKIQPNEVHTFNNIGSNDAEFIPVENPAEEIFQKCQNILPLSAKEIPVYRKCLEHCISELQSINESYTQGQVNKLLQQNGGLSSPGAAIYSHPVCDTLKVRIEYNFQRDAASGRAIFDDNNKVKAVSMPYLGNFIYD